MKAIRLVAAVLLAALSPLTTAQADVPFIRGDTNGDGASDAIDAENIASARFASGPGLPCMDAADANDDGSVNIADLVTILYSLINAIPHGQPFPQPGMDGTTDDLLDCASNEPHPPIPDDGILLSADACSIAGGTDSYQETVIWLQSDKNVGAVQFRLRLEGVADAQFRVGKGMTAPNNIIEVDALDGRTVAFIPDFRMRAIIPGQEQAILKLVICVPEGTQPGVYRLLFENARCGVPDDLNAHIPATASAEVEVRSPVAASNCQDPSVGPVGRPAYRLAGPWGLSADDTEVKVALTVTSPHPVRSLDAAIDFSEYLFDLVRVAEKLSARGINPLSFTVVEGPRGDRPNDSSEGYVAIHVDIPEGASWDAEEPYEVAELTFGLRSPAQTGYGATRIVLRNVGSEPPFTNSTACLVDDTLVTQKPSTSDLSVNLPGGNPPVVEGVDDVQATYSLSEAAGSPGAHGVPVYLSIETNTAIQGFSAAFAYDKEVLAIESFTSLAHMNGDAPDYVNAQIWTPSGSDATHGASLGLVWDFESRSLYYPIPGEPVACARFTILPTAAEGTDSAIVFVDDTIGEPPQINVVVFFGQSLPPGTPGTEVQVTRLLNGKVKVLGEVTPFMRADANLDYYVNIADPVWILGWLFAHGPDLQCPDAADANDDGAIDIADPIAILSTLFGRYSRIAPPYPMMGDDTTPDTQGPCAY